MGFVSAAIEFTLTFPAAGNRTLQAKRMDDGADNSAVETSTNALSARAGRVCALIKRHGGTVLAVPGDLVVQYRPSWFDERAREYSDWQKREWVYYKDCCAAGRA
jgi:hypothetical protein